MSEKDIQRCYTAAFEDEGCGHQVRNASSLRDRKSQGDRFFYLNLKRNTAFLKP